MYFDIEYNKVLNSDVAGETRMTVFRKVLMDCLKQLLSELGHGVVSTSPDCGGITFIEMDSSNKLKFSRHLIVTLDFFAFRDNTHAGFFV